MSVDIDPRASSMWKNPSVKKINKKSSNAELDGGEAQAAYYDKLFQKQVRQIPSFLRVPSQEVLFAKERKYYPEKVKIMMTKSNIQHRDAKKVFGPHDFGIDSPYRRLGPSRFGAPNAGA